MDEGQRAEGTPVSEQQTTNEGARSPEEIRADIDRTREEAGETVESLAAKTDVKAQARQRAEDLKGKAKTKADELKTKADELKTKAQTKTPEGAQQGGQQVVEKVRENPKPVAIGGALFVAFLIGRWTGKR
jgi:ElaB/YqjD/DUF883 family membrane-anchored ribosome-binding protein